jgi:hypothetical protein
MKYVIEIPDSQSAEIVIVRMESGKVLEASPLSDLCEAEAKMYEGVEIVKNGKVIVEGSDIATATLRTFGSK